MTVTCSTSSTLIFNASLSQLITEKISGSSCTKNALDSKRTVDSVYSSTISTSNIEKQRTVKRKKLYTTSSSTVATSQRSRIISSVIQQLESIIDKNDTLYIGDTYDYHLSYMDTIVYAAVFASVTTHS